MSKLICIKICNEKFIAEMIQNYLKMHEIDSIIQTDAITSIFLGNLSSRGFKIMVREEDEKLAREILENQNFETNSSTETEWTIIFPICIR